MEIQKEKVKALLFDLGNVIINVSFAKVIETWGNHAGVTPETLKARFVLDTFYEGHECGETTGKDYFDSLKQSLGINLSYAQFEEGWNAIFVGEVSGIREVLVKAKRHFPLYGFSNTNRTHWDYFKTENNELLSYFQKFFTSFELAQRKPDKAAFEAVSSAIAVKPEEILFFDDLLENANGARAAGLQAVHVRSIADTKNAIESLLAIR
jgi:FMN phosphatase YigB (HAD superfamily)